MLRHRLAKTEQKGKRGLGFLLFKYIPARSAVSQISDLLIDDCSLWLDTRVWFANFTGDGRVIIGAVG